GQDGTDGINGRSVLSGSVAPTTEGADGDFYINTSTWEIYGPKDGSWGDPTSLIGPEGPQGPQGEQGPPGEPGQDGLPLEKFYDVMAYGAVGDGISDDTAAIQQALDDCAAAGGGTVYLPAKTFSISSRLAIGANTVVWAYGATISRASGPLICNCEVEQLPPTEPRTPVRRARSTPSIQKPSWSRLSPYWTSIRPTGWSSTRSATAWRRTASSTDSSTPETGPSQRPSRAMSPCRGRHPSDISTAPTVRTSPFGDVSWDPTPSPVPVPTADWSAATPSATACTGGSPWRTAWWNPPWTTASADTGGAT